jgi:hypothetical protein
MEEQRQFIINEMGLTIASEFDVAGKIRADADPEVEYEIYLECVRLEDRQKGRNGMRLFRLDDFKDYIAGLRKN